MLDFSLTKMPDEAIAYDPSVADTVNLLFKVGQKQRAVDIAKVVGERSIETASYLIAENKGISFELRKNLFLLGAMERSLYENNEVALAENFETHYDRMIDVLQRNSGRMN